ncbi:MAG TPA: COX15/CtaA family protein [Pirellulales bacterium]|nr:COX15/CtaA family protein [Pirellulales bacterium]
MNHSTPNLESPWPHRLAVLLVCATFPLIWVGCLVTTYDAGMAVEDWPTTYGYNLFLYPWRTWLLGPWDLFIEHGHRLLAASVGLVAIALVLVSWLRATRSSVRWLAVATLAAVCFQGVLGGLRVRLDERLLAKIHGCFGPAFFALCVALAVVSSRRWRQQQDQPPSHVGVQGLALVTTLLAYLQIVLGAQLRHVTGAWLPSAFRMAVLFHLLVAALLVVHIVWLAALVLRRAASERWLVRPALGLVLLVLAQLVLGAGTWVLNYNWPAWAADWPWAEGFVVVQESQRQALVTTAHVAAGSLVLVLALLVFLRAWRLEGGSGLTSAIRPARREVLV